MLTKKKLIDLPCTSDAIQQNIKRAYLQTRIWLESPFLNAADRIDAQDYGFNFNAERNILEPCMFLGPQKTYRHAWSLYELYQLCEENMSLQSCWCCV